MFSAIAIVTGSGLFLAGGLTALYGTFVPQSGLWCRNISHGPRGGNRIAITFDDGPSPGYTDRTLDVLAKHRVPAAFFVIGANAAANPAMLGRISAEGHLIGNHTWDHHHFSVFRGYRYWLDQLRRTDDVIHHATGQRPAFFRPPVGIKFIFAVAAAKRLDYQLVTWSRTGRDGVATSSQRILQRLESCAAGDIITLHDGVDPHSPRKPEMTLEALPMLIEQLRGRGLEFVRLDELISAPSGVSERPAGSHP